MSILRGWGSRRELTVTTPQEILDAFVADDVSLIRVPPGTYDFAGISTTIPFDSDRNIKFDGDVTFQNSRFQTQCAEDSAFYADYVASHIAWGGGVWTKTAGGNWAATTDWELFCRDAWYTRSASDTTTFTPNEIPYGTGLAAKKYILCKPTKNVTMSGNLKLDVQSSVSSIWMYLVGLKNCNMRDLTVTMNECQSWAGAFANAVLSVCCALTDFPKMVVTNQESTGTNTRIVQLNNVIRSSVYDLTIGNTNATVGSADLVGLYTYYCRYLQILECHISGINLIGSAGSAFGILSDTGAYCLFRGHSIAPYSSVGAESYFFDSAGTGNVDELEKVAS